MRAAWWTINNQENTGSCVGWATADGVVRWHMVKAGRIGQKVLLSPRHVWMASKETDTITTRPESFIEDAGTTLKAAVDVARKTGVALDGRPALPHPDEDVHRQREHVLRQLRPAKDLGVLQPPSQPDQLEDLAGRQRARSSPPSTSTRRGTTRRRTAARSTSSIPTPCAAVTPSASSDTAPMGGSSSATAGVRAGATRGSATSTPTTSRPRSSTSRTESRSVARLSTDRNHRQPERQV